MLAVSGWALTIMFNDVHNNVKSLSYSEIWHDLHYRIAQVNTFQAVIATNGHVTYVLLTYNKIQWSTSSSQIGMNAGDNLNSFFLFSCQGRFSLINRTYPERVDINNRGCKCYKLN